MTESNIFVQTSYSVAKYKAKVNDLNLLAFSLEKTGTTVRLAKITLAFNNTYVTIIKENLYYNAIKKCFVLFGYVMEIILSKIKLSIL